MVESFLAQLFGDLRALILVVPGAPGATTGRVVIAERTHSVTCLLLLPTAT